MTFAELETFVDERHNGVDSGHWLRVVDAVLPCVWETAIERQLSVADAAVVCDATLLALLDGWEQPTYAVDDSSSMSSLATALRRRAAVECERVTRLNERQSLATISVDLADKPRSEGEPL